MLIHNLRHEAFPKLRFTITPGTLLRGGEYESMGIFNILFYFYGRFFLTYFCLVPPYAESMIDIRTMPGQNQEEIIEKIHNLVDDVIKRRNTKVSCETRG